MDNPVLTVIVCTRNRGSRLSGTLQSLTALPSDIPVEMIVVDNASTDETKAVILDACAKDKRMRYLLVDKVGLGAGRDAAWRAAKGDIISFTDDDCYVAADYSSAIIEAFADHPEAGVIAGRIMLHDPTDAPVTIDESMEPRHYGPYQALLAGQVQGANLSFRRLALERSGGFDTEFGAGTPFPAEDIDAAAAVVWSGFSAHYDPRPMVSHHHRRKRKDIRSLMHGYDRGRGAFWAKYMLRRDTRSAYIVAWWKVTRKFYRLGHIVHAVREYVSAFRYALVHRKFGAIVIAFPIAALALSYVIIRAGIISGPKLLMTWASHPFKPAP